MSDPRKPTHIKTDKDDRPYHWEFELPMTTVTIVTAPTMLCESCYPPDQYLLCRRWDKGETVKVFSPAELLARKGFDSIEDMVVYINWYWEEL